MSEARIPTQYGQFKAVVYESILEAEQHIAFVMGEPSGKTDVLVRVHSECLTGDIFGSRRCDCGPQLDIALQQIAEAGEGVLVYLRGHEVGASASVTRFGPTGSRTRATTRSTPISSSVFQLTVVSTVLVRRCWLISGITTMRLLTNNPAKYGGLDGFGLEITGRVPIETEPTPENIDYLRTKRERMGHLIENLSEA